MYLITPSDAIQTLSIFKDILLKVNLFGNFRFGTGYFEMRSSKSCYLCDLELGDLFDNAVIEQVYSKAFTFSKR